MALIDNLGYAPRNIAYQYQTKSVSAPTDAPALDSDGVRTHPAPYGHALLYVRENEEDLLITGMLWMQRAGVWGRIHEFDHWCCYQPVIDSVHFDCPHKYPEALYLQVCTIETESEDPPVIDLLIGVSGPHRYDQ